MGIPSMNCLIMNKPTGMAKAGKMWTMNVSISPRRSMIKKRGMVTAMGTNIKATVLMANRVCLSLKRFFDRAYAAVDETSIEAATVTRVIRILLKRYRLTGIPEVENFENSSEKLLNVGLVTKN